MGAGDPTPDDTVPGAINLAEGAVDVCDALAKVEAGVVGGLDLLEPQEGGVGPLCALAALETEETTTDVKPFIIEKNKNKNKIKINSIFKTSKEMKSLKETGLK